MTQNLKIEVLTGDISIDGMVVTNLVTKEELSTAIVKKADLGTDGKIPTSQLPAEIVNTAGIVDEVKLQLETSIKDAVDESNAYAESYTDNALSSKADLTSGKVPLEQLPAIDQYPQFGTALSSLSTSILTSVKQRTDQLEKSKADLGEDGKVLREQIPSYEKISGLPEQFEVMSNHTAAVSGELDQHKLQTADRIDTLKENIEANVQQLSDRQSHLMRTYATKELGVDAKVGVKPGEYFNVRSENEEEMMVEYQNVGGGVAVPTGKRHLSALGVQLQEKPARTIIDESGEDLQTVNNGLKNRFVFTSDYGASASKSNNTTELNNAALAAQTYNAVLIFNAYYACTGTVNFPDGLIVCGTSKTKTGLYSTNSVASTAGADVQFSNMKIEGLGKNRVAVSTKDKSLPDFYNCILNGRFDFSNRTGSPLKGCNFDQCDVLSDFGTDYNGIDQMDVFNIYGFNSSKFTNNYIDVDNVHRLWKLTQGLANPDIAGVYADNTRDILIQGNTIKGKGGKQMIDMFFGTSCLKFINNHLELSDQPTLSGATWTAVIDNKTSRPQRDIQDLGDSVYISGNTGFVPCAFLSLQGSFGVTESGFDDSRINSVKILYNEIRQTTAPTIVGAFIQVRYFRSVFSDGNTFQIPAETNTKILELLSNETVSLGSNDKYTGGFVQIGTIKSNSGRITFTGKTGDVTIGALTIKDFNASAALVIAGLDADSLRIGSFKSRPLAGSSEMCRPIYFYDSVRFDYLSIEGVDAKPAVTGGNVAPIFDTISSAARQIYQNCSWQPKFRCYLSAPPTSGTYLRGDTVKHVAPNAGAVAEWTCISGGSPGTWRATSWIVSKGATASRPTLTANDVGVTYLDTTLSASGKPITWIGTAWVDSLGTVV